MTIRTLWLEHAFWSRSYYIALSDNQESLAFADKFAKSNSLIVELLIKQFPKYSTTIQSFFELYVHLLSQLAQRHLTAEAALDQIKQWEKTRNDTAPPLAALLSQYLASTVQSITLRMERKWAAEIAHFNTICAHALALARIST